MLNRVAATAAVAVMAFAALSGSGLLYGGSGGERSAPPLRPSEMLPGVPRPPSTQEAIRFFEGRIEASPQDAISYELLGQLHVIRARETGDVAAYRRAEAALSRSLKLMPRYTPAADSLAAVYLAEHRFEEALDLAEGVYGANPSSTQALATIGDANLALGRYRSAANVYGALMAAGESPPALARLSQLRWLEGDTAAAIELMRRAADQELRSGSTGEATAWYLVRLGDLNFGAGRLEEAATSYRRALDTFEGYYLALAGLGRVRAAQGRLHVAVGLYRRAVSVVPQPDLLAALGDLHALTGHPAEAERRYDTVEFIGRLAALNRQVYNRQLALFYADHERRLGLALELATSELDVRKDVFGYDALAWALHKNGHHRRAAAPIEAAMRLGTREPSLLYHAGMIYAALGDEDRARSLLRAALDINPTFDPLQSPIARATLERLMRGPGSEAGPRTLEPVAPAIGGPW